MGFSQKILLSTTQKMNLTILSEVGTQLATYKKKKKKGTATYVLIHLLK
jgi:hypothetical protein